AKAVGERGRVIAIEPERENFSFLEKNIARNGFSNVKALKIAVGDKDGTTVLHINPLNRGGNSLIPFESYKSGAERHSKEAIEEKYGAKALHQEVPLRTIDTLCNEEKIGDLAIMKMDVEGFELPALQGATRIFSRGGILAVICEVNNKETRHEVIGFMERFGYRPFTLSLKGIPIALPTEGVGRIKGNLLFLKPGITS
ncbi:FkbM family methyltransferase, partial [Candidatus Parcubacteria bacterium]|nr:FkbM family methyltransferase [Candidatus Parcubacteria bacterium]